ncbi:hypothetical protein [Ornithinimicrobium cavernae]|uniref:hypothetical protein n=1 Tax=Ornithinimicrobium cavernae TaxID=2666047 RepID=UPI0012B184D6|nr:hypothetical protein [Ornithinimicrobium cavernae]
MSDDAATGTPSPLTDDELANIGAYCRLAMGYWSQLGVPPMGDLARKAAPGSPIAKHLEDLPADGRLRTLNPAVLAWRSLVSAGEHAGLGEHVHWATSGGVVQRPQTSLARTAMLGAARAIYVLEPEGVEEQRVRAAQLANQEARDAQKILDHWSDTPYVQGRVFEKLADQVDGLADAAAEILRQAGRPPGSHVSESDLLRKVQHTIQDHLTWPDSAVLSYWFMASGTAHARSWVWEHEFQTPAESFVDVWSIPVGFLKQAWTLWNKRRGLDNPQPTPPNGWEADRSAWGPLPGRSFLLEPQGTEGFGDFDG